MVYCVECLCTVIIYSLLFLIALGIYYKQNVLRESHMFWLSPNLRRRLMSQCVPYRPFSQKTTTGATSNVNDGWIHHVQVLQFQGPGIVRASLLEPFTGTLKELSFVLLVTCVLFLLWHVKGCEITPLSTISCNRHSIFYSIVSNELRFQNHHHFGIITEYSDILSYDNYSQRIILKGVVHAMDNYILYVPLLKVLRAYI